LTSFIYYDGWETDVFSDNRKALEYV